MPSVSESGCTVHYTAMGSGPGLVFVHGTGATGNSNWGHLTNSFTDQRTVILPDYSGSGATTDPGGALTIELLARQVAAVARAAAVGPVDLVGFSLGAEVAAALAALEPALVRRLVLVAGWPDSADARLQLGIKLWLKLYETNPSGFSELSTLLGFSPPFLKKIGAAGVAFLARWQPESGIRRQLLLDLKIDLRSLLPQIIAPTLVIGCTQDQLVPVHNAVALHEAIPGSRYQAFDSGHMVLLEQTEAFTTALRNFLFAENI